MRSPHWLTFALVAAPASLAYADETHLRPYIVGSRAAGMGGAFTALSDDPSGSYYNPGGLAFSRRSSVSLTASVYGLVQDRYERVIAGRNLQSSDVQVFPVSTAGLFKLGEVGADGIADHTLAFGVFVPDASTSHARADLGSNENVFIVNTEAQTLWGGAGYSYRARRVGLGFMLFGVQGTESGFLDVSIYRPERSHSFTTLTARSETNWYGALAAFGVRWNPDDSWSLGASIYSPAVGFGSREFYVRFNAGQDSGTPDGRPLQVVVAGDDLETGPTIPLRAQLGAAYSTARFTLAADAIVLAPLRKTFNEGGDFETTLDRPAVLNASVGGELVLTPSWLLRAGLFTDFSAARDPDALVDAAEKPGNSYDVDRLGGTLAIGHRGKHVLTDVGFNGCIGKGQALLPVDLDLSRRQPVEARQRRIYIFVATTYEF